MIDAPEVINSSPYDQAWLIKVKLADPAQVESLMTPAEYTAFAESAAH